MKRRDHARTRRLVRSLVHEASLLVATRAGSTQDRIAESVRSLSKEYGLTTEEARALFERPDRKQVREALEQWRRVREYPADDPLVRDKLVELLAVPPLKLYLWRCECGKQGKPIAEIGKAGSQGRSHARKHPTGYRVQLVQVSPAPEYVVGRLDSSLF